VVITTPWISSSIIIGVVIGLGWVVVGALALLSLAADMMMNDDDDDDDVDEWVDGQRVDRRWR
jgi:hypothetical protein